MMALSDRPTRKAKRTDVDYAVLSSGQQIPDYSDENDDSDDESYGSNYKKKRRKQGAECFICHRPPRTYKKTMLQCDSCSRMYHQACGKPFQSASILGNTSCYECLQEAKVDSLSALPRKTLDSIADFVKVLKKAKKIVVIAGAGISVSCGIPDFRSKDGIYAMARNMDVVLPEPECLFQIDYFRDDPAPFFEVVRNAFANSPKPSPTHWFLKLLQDKKKLLRVYTQNIDGLEEAAGYLPAHIPQVVINKTALKKKKLKSKKLSSGGTMSRVSGKRGGKKAEDEEEEFDMSLLGDCDDVIRYICAQAGWDLDPNAIKASKNKPLMHKSQQIDTEGEPGSGCKTVHYRCNDCFDYDLCGDCYPKRRYKHKGGRHRFTQCI
ncbi:hypothetical protein JG687_00015458 [Phytophthora cactorum]|uniref:Deacetylase sirtuin-type domain-containing protein n=1 Tax=Phytophthora cactorum TaxID=29920 RepID=A0A8T1TUK4_9STRA|nr:hypothetical protein JG687_00015458 [Phytophthora cactorum]